MFIFIIYIDKLLYWMQFLLINHIISILHYCIEKWKFWIKVF